MRPIKLAILKGIEHLEKYYNKTEASAANIISLCTVISLFSVS